MYKYFLYSLINASYDSKQKRKRFLKNETQTLDTLTNKRKA